MRGLGLGLGLRRRSSGAAPDPVIKMLAHRVYGPGYNSGAAPLVGDGSAKTFANLTLANESGAAISKCSIVSQGWTLRTTGFTDTGNNFNTTWTVEYPVGTTVGTIAFDTVSGFNSESAELTLSTPIPVGATFGVRGSSTVPNGQNYISNLGFAGLRNHAKKSLLKKLAIAAFGDSIQTNNSGSFYVSAAGKCPVYLNSITGTTAATYAASAGAQFVRQADLVEKLGITDVVCNFGTNDYGASTSVATLQGYITTLRDMVRAKGAKYNHQTMLPRGKTATTTPVTASSVTSTGNTINMVVPDASKFVVGIPFTIAGATQSEYNGTKMCTAVNTGTNTVSFLFVGSGTTPATGTITVIPWKMGMAGTGFWEAYSAKFNAGAGSDRGLFNAWVRGGNVDGYIDWADACEPSRDSGRFKVAGEGSLMPTTQTITVSSVTSTSRFNSDYDRGTGTIANGLVQAKTGGNIGVLKTGSNNTNGDITLTAAWSVTQQVGDQYIAMPGTAVFSDDWTHPRVSQGGKGGQAHLDDASLTWINAKLAA